MRAAHRARLYGLQELSAVSRQVCGSVSSEIRECFAFDALHARAEATLAYEEVVARSPGQKQDDQLNHGIIVHGLLGTGRNWRTFARLLAKQAAAESGRGWRIALVDQRNHGRSAENGDFHPPHTMQAAAKDLVDLVQHNFGGQQLNMIVGHSLGGKTTLEFLTQVSQSGSKLSPPQQAWVLDANIGKVTLNKDAPSDVDKIIKEIKDIPLPIASRDWLYKYMEDRGYSIGLRLWMGSNLIPDGHGKLKWGFNIQGADDMYESYRERECWDVVKAPPQGTVLNIVRAANSDRWTKQTMLQLEQAQQSAAKSHPGQLNVHVLPNAGHWLHVDNPRGLMDMMLPSLVDP
ncbi:hypothetical protein ABBQ32_005867 [Trebouxia sp. C0010 RCD-2024]